MIPDWVSFFPPLTLLFRCHRYPPRWWTRGFQIQTSCSAVRSQPTSPVLSTPRGSIKSNLTSFSAYGLCSTPFGTTNIFSRPDTRRGVSKIDTQIPFDDDERLISISMMMPDKVSLQLHNLELVIVHFSDHFWLPLLMKQAKLLHKADCSVFHSTSVCQ